MIMRFRDILSGGFLQRIKCLSRGCRSVSGRGHSIGPRYGALAAREIGEAFQRQDFSFKAYRQRVLKSSLGQALLARWFVAEIIYLIIWKWFQVLVWRILKPIVILIALIFILNRGKRMPTTL